MRSKKNKICDEYSLVKGGYQKGRDFFITFFNFVVTFCLFVLSLPIFVSIMLLIKIVDGGDIFYRSVRLGKNHRLFTMYKFRTLSVNAHEFVGARHVNDGLFKQNHMISRLGQFLRETRLDELPQLVNILKGEMDLVGPRPHRPEIFEEFKKHYKYYGKLLNVKPGLIGYRQLYTPHSSPIKLQILYDYRFIDIKQYALWNLYFVATTVLGVCRIIFQKFGQFLYHDLIRCIFLRSYSEKRLLERVFLEDAHIYIGVQQDTMFKFGMQAKLFDINEEALCVHSTIPLEEKEVFLKMETFYTKKPFGKGVYKSAICRGTVIRDGRTKEDLYSYVLKYFPVSPLNDYKVHKYFLLESMLG